MAFDMSSDKASHGILFRKKTKYKLDVIKMVTETQGC